MDEAEKKVFSTLTRLRTVLGIYIIELRATDEEIKTLVDAELWRIRSNLPSMDDELPTNAPSGMTGGTSGEKGEVRKLDGDKKLERWNALYDKWIADTITDEEFNELERLKDEIDWQPIIRKCIEEYGKGFLRQTGDVTGGINNV